MSEKKSYSVQELAKRHGVSQTQIRKYIHGDLLPKLPAVPEGTKFLIDATDADAWWAERRRLAGLDAA